MSGAVPGQRETPGSGRSGAGNRARALRVAARDGSVRRRDLLRDPLSVMRGVVELARARRKLGRIRSTDVAALNARAHTLACDRAGRDPPRADTVDRIAVVIANVARIVPWRADCLVQAMAAQHWLASHGLASRIEIGLPPVKTEPFEPHALLVHRGTSVTGGEVTDYSILLGQSQPASANGE
jgi:hypothetical protein